MFLSTQGSLAGQPGKTMGEVMTKKQMLLLVSFGMGILGWHLLLPEWHAFLFFGDRHSPDQFFSWLSRESIVFDDDGLPVLIEHWELMIPAAILTVLGIPGVMYIIGGIILNFISTLLKK